MSESDGYVDAVVESWTQTHKKGALALLILVALHRGPAWTGHIKEQLAELTHGHVDVDDQSLHRTLRRLDGHNLVTHSTVAADGTGARRKVFELTVTGEAVLQRFLATTMSYTRHPDFLAVADRLT